MVPRKAKIATTIYASLNSQSYEVARQKSCEWQDTEASCWFWNLETIWL